MTKKSTLLFKKNTRVTLEPTTKGKWYAALCESGARVWCRVKTWGVPVYDTDIYPRKGHD